jgi:16S rRNA (guanine(966)-N(2))-methyltransferase RsmD
MDKVREAVFAILGDLSDKAFLDAFSGSGIIALEAASRGAARVELVENDRVKIDTVLKNSALAERTPAGRIQCHFVAAELFLKRCKTAFDFIFFDPPFLYGFHRELIQTVSDRRLLSADGMALIHRPSEKPLPDVIGELTLVDRRKYGRSVVDFYRAE